MAEIAPIVVKAFAAILADPRLMAVRAMRIPSRAVFALQFCGNQTASASVALAQIVAGIAAIVAQCLTVLTKIGFRCTEPAMAVLIPAMVALVAFFAVHFGILFFNVAFHAKIVLIALLAVAVFVRPSVDFGQHVHHILPHIIVTVADGVVVHINGELTAVFTLIVNADDLFGHGIEVTI